MQIKVSPSEPADKGDARKDVNQEIQNGYKAFAHVVCCQSVYGIVAPRLYGLQEIVLHDAGQEGDPLHKQNSPNKDHSGCGPVAVRTKFLRENSIGFGFFVVVEVGAYIALISRFFVGQAAYDSLMGIKASFFAFLAKVQVDHNFSV